MIAIAIQSGSNGNCIYVEAGKVRLLFDAGISGLQAQLRLEALGRNIRAVDAVILSHDHADHTRCAGIYQRKFRLPIYASAGTIAAAAAKHRLGALHDVRNFIPGQSLAIGDAVVHTIPTPHDGVDGVAFVVEADGRRLGILTDLGHVFSALPKIVHSLDAVFLESNYDPKMLAEGPYPPMLQARIRGDGGHISNHESAELLRSAGSALKWACLSHLSEQNNTPQLAMRTHRQMLGRDWPLLVASRYAPTAAMEV